MKKITNGEPHILLMDANSFFDVKSDLHLNILEDDYDDVYRKESLELDSNKPIYSTFVGFESDPFKKNDIYDIEDGHLIDYPSILDHVLQFKNKSKLFEISNTRICTRKINNAFVTDHLPLVFDFIFYL